MWGEGVREGLWQLALSVGKTTGICDSQSGGLAGELLLLAFRYPTARSHFLPQGLSCPLELPPPTQQ